MRDGTPIEGTVQLQHNQSLVHFMNARSGWINMTQARRANSDDAAGHMIVQTDHVIMASAPDGDIHVAVSAASGSGDRIVELVLQGGQAVVGYVPAAPGQRLSDCVASSGKFLGLSLARLFPSGTDVGDIAVQTSAIVIVRDLKGAPEHP